MNTFRNKNKTAHHITTLEDVIVPINASDENGNRIETETRVHPLLAFSESPIRKWLKGDDKRQLEVEDEQLRMKNAEKTKRQQEDYIGPEKTGLNSIRMTDSMIGHVSSIDDDDATAATATAAADTDAASTATAARIQEDGKPDNKIAEQAIAVALGDCTSFANVPFETKPTPQLVSSSGDSPGTADSSTTKASAPSTAASASEKVPHSSDRPPSSLKKPGSQKKQLRAIFSDVLQQEETSERKETTGQQRSGSGGSSRSSFHQEVREEEEEKQEGETDPALASIIKDIKSMISAPSSNAAAAGGINNNNSPGATKNPASKPPTYTIEQLEKLEKSLLLDDNAEGGLNKTLAALTAVQTTQLKNTTPSTKSLDDDKTPQKSRTLLSSRPADFAGDDDFVIPAGNDVKTPNTNSSATTTNTPAAHKRILQLDRLRDAQRTAYPFRRDLSIIKRWEPLNISAISDMRQTVFGTKFTANGLKDVSSLPPIKSTAERWGAEDYEVKRQLGEVAKFSMTQDFWNIIRFSAEED